MGPGLLWDFGTLCVGCGMEVKILLECVSPNERM